MPRSRPGAGAGRCTASPSASRTSCRPRASAPPPAPTSWPTGCRRRTPPSPPASPAAGAVLLGKVNTHEFAFGATTWNLHGRTRNPWDPERVAAGSSGGSGAALAAGLAAFSIGSDTAGSIRGPAAYCGIAGLKPSWGLVSAAGVV